MVLSASAEILFQEDSTMLDYKDIIVKHFGLGMSERQIARELGVSKSGVNDVLGGIQAVRKSGFPSAGGNHQLRDRRKDLRRQPRRGWP